jgi:predicted RNA polymerase sigma factor
VPADVEDLLRKLAPQVLGVLTRRYGDFDAAEDAVQEALLAAAVHWSKEGIPQQPRGWLIQTAIRRLIDQHRNERSRMAARTAPCSPSRRRPTYRGGTTRSSCSSSAATRR